MEYRFVVDYTPTDPAGVASQRVCSPIYGDDLAVSIEMENDEWYRKRKLEGKLTFLREDYGWIMGQAFDGTFKLTIQSSTDGGASWQPYLEGTFSRANLEIDEDNQNCVLNGLNEGSEYNAIENGKSEEYDLMKIIPDSEAKEVQGEVHPALAMVDYSSDSINQSDIYCDAAGTSSGYKSDKNDWTITKNAGSNNSWLLCGVYAEADVVMTDGNTSEVQGRYCGVLNYRSVTYNGHTVRSIEGTLWNENRCQIQVDVSPSSANALYANMYIYGSNGVGVVGGVLGPYDNPDGYYNPATLLYNDFGQEPFEKVEIFIHYIRATLLTQSGGNADNVLDTGDYYKRMAAFNNQDGGLTIAITTNMVEQPNGHRLVPGTGEQGTTPQYFAPPNNTDPWIPLCESEWQYASMWYTIEPSVENGLLDSTKVGSFRWTRCWTLGTCIDRLLRKITNNKVTFDQSVAGSEFLYSTVNPLTQGEPFEYLFTQKSNVMRPSLGGESAARCIVRLEWFLEFLRNGLNCYWWLKEQNGGTYAFRVEHVEWFRRGGSYTGYLGNDPQIFNLTKIKTRRNFPRNGEAAKHLDDQLHKYSYEVNGMTEKYTFSWQGDGGSDAFKGNPMFFKAGWVEKGTSESKEVDNIFADLSWLMLNAGTDTASSKNFDGLFMFAGYRPIAATSIENQSPTAQTLYLSGRSTMIYVAVDIWLTAPAGSTIDLKLLNSLSADPIETYVGTGVKQVITIVYESAFIVANALYLDFGANYANVTIHRIHARTGNVYNVPNTTDRLNPDNYLQNGPLSWPWLQNEFLHYDIPAQRWSFDSDDIDEATFLATGTVKLRKKQEVPLLPLPTKSDEEKLDKGVIGGLRDSHQQLQTGIVKSATISMGTRNANLTLMYDMIS